MQREIARCGGFDWMCGIVIQQWNTHTHTHQSFLTVSISPFWAVGLEQGFEDAFFSLILPL